MKKFVKFLSLLLVFSLFSSTVSFAVSVPMPQEQMTDICLVSTDEYFVVVSVPESKAAAYQERLETDQKFFQTQLQEVARSSQYPGFPGRVVFEKDMDKNAIKMAVDAESGVGTFNRFLATIVNGATNEHIRTLLGLTKVAGVYQFIAKLLTGTILLAQTYREAWWNQALIDILEGNIRAVRYVIIENTTDYPKIWRLFVRV